ncbi:MAG: FHA domain-containing protein [Anaerolineae bacterium]|uniref:FHA domain-containing protein n=1 Tax=Candidatus Flexifilum breve TaxID=3140694 RepID=UPI001ACA9827|nr:FHA domain-containing protein [Chloroflexota bacterium]MBK9748762.1 FHA domain-containing protein [Chloroflexota bacterium]MBN8634321.1 FHA domain-containing protein [Anaerolineae bacterium]
MSQLVVRVANSENAVISIDPPAAEGYVIGRSDEASSYVPDIDLVQYDAREKGVSRRHSALVRFQGATCVIDLNSVNGTFVDGKRLAPDSPHPIGRSCNVTLGTLTLSISNT